MFWLSEKSNYDKISCNLVRFLKCSTCHLVPKSLKRVCKNAHFFCEHCCEYKMNILLSKRRCLVCKEAFAINRPTIFNALLELVQSADLNSSEFMEKLVQILECPVCYEETISSLKVCNSGHIVCRRCSLFTTGCPLCRECFVSPYCIVKLKRNLKDALLHIPCYNQPNGCEIFNDYYKLKSHIEDCSFVSWRCGDGDCSWSGLIEATPSHAMKFHSNCILQGRRVRISLQLDDNLHLQLWNSKKDLDYYKLLYQMTEKGLKLGIYCQKSRSEKIIFQFNDKEPNSYIVPYIQTTKNPFSFLKNVSETLVPVELIGTNIPFLECILQVEEGRWHSVIILILKFASIMIKLLTI